VSTPDFEITVGLQAREIVQHVVPEPETETTGEGVSLDRAETRAGLPSSADPNRRYEYVVLHKCIVGETTECRDSRGTPSSKRKASG
jgi:hypothetical protein